MLGIQASSRVTALASMKKEKKNTILVGITGKNVGSLSQGAYILA